MAVLIDIGKTPFGATYLLLQDAQGVPMAVIGDDDQLEELARDVLDFIGRDYCLPYVCDHLEAAERSS